MNKPLFISIDGIDGCGKTENIQFICSMLEQNDIDFVNTREPGGTLLGEAVREIVLGEQYKGMADDTELLLMFAARAEHVAQVIRPALEQNKWVCCDRHIDASYAYQGGGRQIDSRRIEVLDKWVMDELRPDLTILLDAPIDVVRERMGQRGTSDRFEQEQGAFFNRVRDAYLERAKADPQRIKVVDAGVALESVQEQIQALLTPFLP